MSDAEEEKKERKTVLICRPPEKETFYYDYPLM
jgi:hypothetical protein